MSIIKVDWQKLKNIREKLEELAERKLTDKEFLNEGLACYSIDGKPIKLKDFYTVEELTK